VSAAALGLALGAACLHALWNVLLGGSRDVLAATAVALATSVVAAAPLAVLTWDLEADAVPFVVASGALETAYFFLLARAYQEADVSVVYPIARGGAPVLVLLGGLAIGDRPSALAAAGVVVVALGVLAVRSGAPTERRALVLGGAVAACIAAYTLVDSRGIEHAAPVAYLELVLLPVCVAALAVTRRARLRAELRPATVVAGLLGFAAYCLVLAALRLAPAAPVAAARETSVVFAVALAGALLGEPVGRRRLAGAALVVAGVFLLAV
jgi:drug/metabolite transporter (DMT)-like permease